jgi:carbamoyl-phosphate synthase large subunit
MRSTGEVMGIAKDFSGAFARSQAGAGSQLPANGGILFSLADKDKKEGLRIAQELARMGFSLFATESTAEFFRSNQLDVKTVLKITEGRPHVVDVIRNRDVALVINTPSGTKTRSEGFTIRQAAQQFNVPIVITIAAARAAATGIKAQRQGNWTVTSLQNHYYL